MDGPTRFARPLAAMASRSVRRRAAALGLSLAAAIAAPAGIAQQVYDEDLLKATPKGQSGAWDDFFHAVKVDDARAVARLLAKGFDPNAVEPERGDNGLILALRENCMKVFRVLLDAPGIDIEHEVRNGDTAIMIAAFKGNLPAVRALLEKGAEINRPGWTALHYAAASGSTELVALLLDRSAYIDAESPNKTTPLMMAAWQGHADAVRLLLEEGADPRPKNLRGMTATDFARVANRQDIADLIAAHTKAHPKPEYVPPAPPGS